MILLLALPNHSSLDMYVFAFYHPISYSSPLLLVSSQRISLACLVHYYCRGDDGVSTQSTMCHKNMLGVRSSCPDYDRYRLVEFLSIV